MVVLLPGGRKDKDSVLAFLAKGEKVIPNKSINRKNAPLIDYISKTR